MHRLLTVSLIAAVLAAPASADGMQATEREVPQRVIEETVGASSQHLVLPAMIGLGLFTAYMIFTKRDG